MDKKEMAAFLKNDIAIEEKVDGSNLGISITEDYKVIFQNRFAPNVCCSLLEISHGTVIDRTMYQAPPLRSGSCWTSGSALIQGFGKCLTRQI